MPSELFSGLWLVVMRTVIIVQARMASTRLPGKVCMDILGKPMLEHIVERLRRAGLADAVAVATTARRDDAPVRQIAQVYADYCYSGSEADVLDRYYRCAGLTGADVVVRVTGDCPVIDPVVVDRTIAFFEDGDYDHVGLSGYPDGLDTEVFTRDALEKAWREAALPSEREHVTPYMWKHPERFKVASMRYREDFSHMRWTVDEPRDLEFIRKVYEELYAENPSFGMDDIVSLLRRRPELSLINKGIRRNEGYEKSLREDNEREREREGGR